MTWAGFVLTGGASTRMGRDKAELSFRGQPLGLWVARQVEEAVGNVTLVGGRARNWGIPVLQDAALNAGPLGGIVAALRASQAPWNLVVACDMPAVSVTLFRELMALGEEQAKDAVVPVHPDGRVEPLCAGYHQRALAHCEAALSIRELSIHKILKTMEFYPYPIHSADTFANANSPSEWVEAGGELG